MWRAESLEKTLMLRKMNAGEGDDIRWDGWMLSLTQQTWVWDSSRRWWRTGKPGMLLSIRSQGFSCNWTTKTKDLNVRPETIKIMEENRHSNLTDISLVDILVDMPPKAMETKVKKKCDYIKLKMFCIKKDITTKMKMIYRLRESICKWYYQLMG